MCSVSPLYLFHLLRLHPLGLSPSAQSETVSVSLISIDTPAIDQADYTASCLLIKESCVWMCTWLDLCVCVYNVFIQHAYI